MVPISALLKKKVFLGHCSKKTISSRRQLNRQKFVYN